MSTDGELSGPAPREELAAVRWVEDVIRARDVGIDRYTPAPLRAEVRAEQDAAFSLPVPIGTLRLLRRHIARLKARELRP